MTHPIIGITGNTSAFKNDDFEAFKINYSSTGFSTAISLAGGTPIIIPINDATFAKEYIQLIDGLLLTGGQDVTPMLYGEEPRKVIGPTSPERDKCEVALVKEAIRQKKPILGICRGLQLINVVLGGSLLQDLSEDESITIQHVQRSQPEFSTHSIKVKSGTHIAEIIDNNSYVNSIHHQAIKELGKGLTVSAWSPDNVIEAIEVVDDNQSIIGIQWHPELTFLENHESLSIFKDLIKRSISSKSSM
ncbi:gamma-glutamyl-gamma-aminobutyrate hydrolase family protein [Fundicoccus sp. Sow4_D5]|uniref:gamma-glutamyl-gamma-aminobutyrate hydrolase family protein n=1 Tax=Fundicoccus sp. Sow4_D5 TaxID=3438782 RepID=UPI003F907A4F